MQRGQAALSKGISSDTINAIFDELYRREATGGVDTTLLTATEVTAAQLGRRARTPSTCATPSRGRPAG